MVDIHQYDLKIIVHKVCYDLFNNHRHDTACKYFDADFIFTFNQYHLHGRNNLVLLLKEHAKLFPRTHAELTSIISEGDIVCARWEMVFGIQANDKPFTASGITMFQFRNDKIIKAQQYWNTNNPVDVYSTLI